MRNNTYDGLIYACAKGRQKEWARERLIIDTLYNTTGDIAHYLEIQDINKLDKCDEETDKYYIYKFGYHYQIPKTEIVLYISEIDLYISKKDNRLFIRREGLGYAYDNVEKSIYNFIKTQIKIKNLYIRTSLNDEKYLIK